MLEPREGLGEAGFAGAPLPLPGVDILRAWIEDEMEDERDGGSEFRSGDMSEWNRWKRRM
jgi:hypothetical protein